MLDLLIDTLKSKLGQKEQTNQRKRDGKREKWDGKRRKTTEKPKKGGENEKRRKKTRERKWKEGQRQKKRNKNPLFAKRKFIDETIQNKIVKINIAMKSTQNIMALI